MNSTELRKAIEHDRKRAANRPMATFDLEFLAHAYLAALYEHRILNRMPAILTNIKQLPWIGALLVCNRWVLSPNVRSHIPTDGVPTKKELTQSYDTLGLEGMMSKELRGRVESVL
jgi:hypothetical protein